MFEVESGIYIIFFFQVLQHFHRFFLGGGVQVQDIVFYKLLKKEEADVRVSDLGVP